MHTLPRHARLGDTQEVALQARCMWQAWYIGKHHECIRMCLNEIVKRLFAGSGLVAMRGDQVLQTTPAFAAFMHRELVPCARDAFFALQAFGVVPVAFSKGDEHVESGAGPDRLLPFVPAFGTYTITTGSRNGRQYFCFYWGNDWCTTSVARRGGGNATGQSARWGRNGAISLEGMVGSGCGGTYVDGFGRRDESVIVMHDFGWNPDLDGTLCSNLSTLVEHVMFHNELRDAAITAERIGSNPAVFTAYNPAVDAAVQRDDRLQQASFAGSAMRQDAMSSGALYERTPEEVAGFRVMLRSFQEQTGLDAGDHFGVSVGCADAETRDPVASRDLLTGRQPGTGHVMPWASQFYLGSTRQLVHQQMPQTRNDLVPLTQQLQETVCGVLSVPRTLIVADSGVKAGVEATESTMNRTVQHWSDLLSQVLTRVYNHLFGEQDLAEELRLRVEQKRRLLRHRHRQQYPQPAAKKRRRRTVTHYPNVVAFSPPVSEDEETDDEDNDDGYTAVPMPTAKELITPEDLFQAAAKTNVRLTFDLVPITNIEQLDHLHDRGVIDWRVYAESLLRLNSLPRSFLASKTEPTLASLPDMSPFARMLHDEQVEDKKLKQDAKKATSKPSVK